MDFDIDDSFSDYGLTVNWHKRTGQNVDCEETWASIQTFIACRGLAHGSGQSEVLRVLDVFHEKLCRV